VIDDMRCIAYADYSFRDDRAIERGAAIQFRNDAVQHRRVLDLSIGIKGGYHATVAQLLGMDERLVQLPAQQRDD